MAKLARATRAEESVHVNLEASDVGVFDTGDVVFGAATGERAGGATGATKVP
jgi:hypothetical protein